MGHNYKNKTHSKVKKSMSLKQQYNQAKLTKSNLWGTPATSKSSTFVRFLTHFRNSRFHKFGPVSSHPKWHSEPDFSTSLKHWQNQAKINNRDLLDASIMSRILIFAWTCGDFRFQPNQPSQLNQPSQPSQPASLPPKCPTSSRHRNLSEINENQ